MNDKYDLGWDEVFEDCYSNYDNNNMVEITYAERSERVGDIGVIVGKVKKEGVAQSFSEYYVLTHYGILKKASDCIRDLGMKCTPIYKYLYV